MEHGAAAVCVCEWVREMGSKEGGKIILQTPDALGDVSNKDKNLHLMFTLLNLYPASLEERAQGDIFVDSTTF